MSKTEGVSIQNEKDQFADRLQTLIRAVSHKMNLRVKTALDPAVEMQMRSQGEDPEKAWFYEAVQDYVYIPPEMFTIPENEAKGKAAHEASHVVITRMHKIVPIEVANELGLTPLLMALEERPTDEYVRKYTVGAGAWLDEARSASFAEGEVTLKKRMAETGSAKKPPKLFQLCNLMVYERFADRSHHFVDDDVWEMYQQLKDEVERVENALPSYQGSEEEVMEKAIERYGRTYKNIWPIAKKLIEEDKEMQEMQEMLKQRGAFEKLMRQLGDELQKELEQILSGEDGDSADKNSKDDDTAKDPDLSRMSKELRQAMRKSFESLPEDVQQAIRERAQEQLRQMEREFVKKHESKLTENGGLDDTEVENKAEKSPQEASPDLERARRAKRIGEVMEETEAISASDSEHSGSEYERSYQEVSSHIERLYKRLEGLFHPNIKKLAQLRSGGSKINLDAVFKREAQRGGGAQSIDNKIFEVTHFPEPRDYAVTLLVDLSSSMRNSSKIEQAFKGTIMLAEALHRLGIKTEILGFQDEVIVFKDFSTDLTDSIREKMSGMLKEVQGLNPRGHNRPGANDDGPCLALASKRLGAWPAKHKTLLVISDGQPSGFHSDERDLENTVRDINTKTDQVLIGLGLGKDTGHVEHFYGKNSLPNIQPEELPDKLGDLLYDVIHSPGQYHRS